MTPVESRTAAIVTVGSEIVDGLALDTNTREIARALTAAGYRVHEAISVPDDELLLAATLTRLTAAHELVIATGGLGPTHDDITREAASEALGRPLIESAALCSFLEPISRRHSDPEATRQVFRQAQILEGARVIMPTSGTAPGQVADTPGGSLVLLPGPPHEMRPMLEQVLEDRGTPVSRILSCVGISESDAQVIALRAIADIDGVGLTVLATPGQVRVVLLDHGSGPAVLDEAASICATALGMSCHSTSGETLAESVIRILRSAELTVAFAESCTGGLVSAELTSVPGASEVFLGSVVTYSDMAKETTLGVSELSLAQHGAISDVVAREMAAGVKRVLGADIAVSITGIAGPGGATPEKPVGLVWFGIANGTGLAAEHAMLPGDRDGIRLRAQVRALDLVRRALVERTE